MVNWRTVGTEASALAVVALSLPLRLIPWRERHDPSAPHATPVVLVHGFLGDPTNFLALRSYLARFGVRNFATFGYTPRLDYQRLAVRLARAIEIVLEETGADSVDVVGHSLGGLVARYMVEIMGDDFPVRRLVTLGAPYFASPFPERELAIFAADDPFVPPPHPTYRPQESALGSGQVIVVPHCGHWGLLYHATVLHEAASFLCPSGATLEVGAPRLALDAAS